MNETRLKILSAALFVAVAGLTLERFGVFGGDDSDAPICSDGDLLSAARTRAPTRQQPTIDDLGLAERSSTLPATPVGSALTWALDTINTGTRTVSADDLTTRFAPSALERIPVGDLQREMVGLASAGPYVVVGHKPGATETAVEAVLQGANFHLFDLTGSVEADEPYRIVQFRISARD
jgi:hypothetical protein